jgi:hypothetical protein
VTFICFRPIESWKEAPYLWYPWSLCALRELITDISLSSDEQSSAKRITDMLKMRLKEYDNLAESDFNYAASEGLIALAWQNRPVYRAHSLH